MLRAYVYFVLLVLCFFFPCRYSTVQILLFDVCIFHETAFSTIVMQCNCMCMFMSMSMFMFVCISWSLFVFRHAFHARLAYYSIKDRK